MASLFSFNQSLPSGTTTTATYTAKQQDHGIQGTATFGPMPDPAQSVDCEIQKSTDGGSTWFGIGGVIGSGGLTGPRGGPYTDPVFCSATTFAAIVKGDLIRASITIVNGPVQVAFQGDLF